MIGGRRCGSPRGDRVSSFHGRTSASTSCRAWGTWEVARGRGCCACTKGSLLLMLTVSLVLEPGGLQAGCSSRYVVAGSIPWPATSETGVGIVIGTRAAPSHDPVTTTYTGPCWSDSLAPVHPAQSWGFRRVSRCPGDISACPLTSVTTSPPERPSGFSSSLICHPDIHRPSGFLHLPETTVIPITVRNVSWLDTSHLHLVLECLVTCERVVGHGILVCLLKK